MLSNINGGNNENVTSGPLQQFKRRKVQTIRYLSSFNYLQINLIIKMKRETRKGMYTIFG